MHDGQKPRPLQLNATSRLSPQSSHFRRAKPRQSSPQPRQASSSFTHVVFHRRPCPSLDRGRGRVQVPAQTQTRPQRTSSVRLDRRSPILIGQSLAQYRITAAIGAGGMGEVYRATDTKLGRDVAIKVLPAELAQDPERLARFEREAKLLASLNHPNIAHVYGFESATLDDGSAVHFLAMELVEGEDLAERLKRGAIPVDEALAIAKQIAEALEEAHEHGIVHRDLKPANVKVTPGRQGEGARLRPGQGLRRGRRERLVAPTCRNRRRSRTPAPRPA